MIFDEMYDIIYDLESLRLLYHSKQNVGYFVTIFKKNLKVMCLRKISIFMNNVYTYWLFR